MTTIRPKRALGRGSQVRARERQRAFDTLREAFLAGRFKPGDVVTVRALTDAFALSTLPVREATARLVGEGALKRERNGRLRVPELGFPEYSDITSIRLALEPLAAAEAARHHAAADRLSIETALSTFLRAYRGPISPASLGANARLHFAIYRAAHRPHLLQIIEALWLRSGPLLTTTFPGNSLASSGREGELNAHRRLVELVAAQDPDGASAAMMEILEAARDHVLRSHRFPG
jgi:DNA-binding GntR family transcriptional regulator